MFRFLSRVVSLIDFSDLTLELGLRTVKEQMLPGFLVMFLV